MIDKKDMTEEEIKLNFITPAITKKWPMSCIRMEYYFTKGRIMIDGRKAKRGKANKADYILYYNDISSNFPIAVVEAKDNNHSPLGGLGQAIGYAETMKIPFAFASNGDSFTMHDLLTGTELEDIALDDFPSPEELKKQYRQESGFSDKEESMLSVPYYYREGDHEPRYYQWIAINKVLSGIARGDKRMLIVLATGTGKTLVAFQIIWRLLKAKAVRRVLFLADRDVLVSQPMRDDFSPFGGKMFRIEKREMDTAHEVYLSLYHQLKNGAENFYTAYDRDFFDLVIVDECHRGSANDDSSWHEILEYFDSAIQVGMTATPIETKETSNIEYFGEPVYTYSLKQGINDGFLAPYKVIRVNLDIDINGYRPYPGQVDINGEPLDDRIYEQKDFDRVLVVRERTELVAKRVSDFLKETDRTAKTIVFCEDIPHAERMRKALVNENSDLVVSEPHYIVQITSGSEEKGFLDDFTDPHEDYPVVAVTSRLMSTGVNTQTCQLVVLDRTIGSMTEFKQIIGRGTRVREDCGKMYFTIMDFRKNYVKFADPAFDGEPVRIKDVGEDEPFNPDDEMPDDEETGTENPVDDGDDDWTDDGGEATPDNTAGEKGGKRKSKKRFVIKGIEVNIVNEKVEYLDANGNLITASIIDCSRSQMRRLYPYYEEFQKVWLAQKKKQDLLQKLVADGVFVDFVKETLPAANVDDYDVLSYIGYNKQPLTKDERIDKILVSGYLDKFSKENQDIIRLLLEAYREHDIDELASMRILNMPEFVQKGNPPAIVKGFGGKKKYTEMISEVEYIIYSENMIAS
ncbi:MAG: DEAD/DEAH box helicase family protein [Lachnospiraceae bacterium]|nr:DEAD/DEAH box helicase family protein [Lachnospiraceae bacterium]